MLLALAAAPSALATYRDVATSYGTAADVKANGDEIPAADVPDGTYRNIEVRTSSSFCAVTNCTVKKSGSSMTATFTLTRTYTALFVGTADEAAEATDEAGEDASAYILGDEVTVGKTRLMRFSMPVSAFNAPISIASFNGGSKSFEKACWYDRSIMFDSNSEVAMAVSAGTGPKGPDDGDDDDSGEGPADDDGGKGGSKGTDDGGDDGSDDSNDDDADDSDGAGGDDSGKKNAQPEDEGKAKQGAASDDDGDVGDEAEERGGAAAVAGGGSSGSGDGGSSGTSGAEKAADAADTVGASGAHGGIPATPLHFASIDLGDDVAAVQGSVVEEEAPSVPGLPAATLVAACAFVLLLCGGVAVQSLWFRGATKVVPA